MFASGLMMAFPVYAEPVDAGDDTAAAMSNIISLIEDETEIATKIKMNADYVPGMVSVLHGGELELLGVRNVWEALALLPGVDATINALGEYQVSVRGIGGTYLSSNIKHLINGIPVHNSFTGVSPALAMPIGEVERIEFISGPGSAIHGEYAYAGVIDIITRSEGNRAFGQYGSFNSATGTMTLNAGEDDWHVGLNLGGWKTDGAKALTGTDALANNPQLYPGTATSNAPGYTNEKASDGTAVLQLRYKGLSLGAQHMVSSQQDSFGAADLLSAPGAAGRTVQKHDSIELKQKVDFGEKNALEFRAGFQKALYRGENYTFIPVGYTTAWPGNPATPGSLAWLAATFGWGANMVYPNGMIATVNYEERKATGGFNLVSKSVDKHTLLAGVDYSRTQMGDIWYRVNVDPLTSLPAVIAPPTWVPLQPAIYRGASNFLQEGKSREVISTYLQDQFDITSDFALTMGVRYDHYNDVGSGVTPRVAAVYRLDERNILKMQYAQSFRPPTFFEMYVQNTKGISGNLGLRAERSQNYELGYVYREAAMAFRTTLFYTRLQDHIALVQLAPAVPGSTTPQQYQNIGRARSAGAEIGFEHNFGLELKLDSNASFVRTHNDSQGGSIEGAADWLANAVLTYNVSRDYSLSAWGRYVASRQRAFDDARPAMKGYGTLDLSGSAENLLLKGVMLRGGVRNVTDAKVYNPSPALSYVGDYPRAGRTWWMQLSYGY